MKGNADAATPQRLEGGRPGAIRVAHVVTRMSLGGAQENTLLTVLGLARRGYSVDLIAGTNDTDEGPLPLPPGAPPVRVVPIPELARRVSPLREAAAFRRLVRVLRAGGYHIVHTHMPKPGVLGRLAARAARVPVVVHTMHGSAFHAAQPAYVRRAIILLERVLARQTTYVLSVSRRLAEDAVERGIVAADKISTVYSGMELEWFTECGVDGAEARAALGISPGAPVAGTVARLVPLKGHDLLLDAVPRVVAAFPEARFLLVGGGPLRERLQARARALGVADNVIFTGEVPRERVPGLMAAMDLLVHPSLREGLARVLPQALAMGRPCVALNVDGAPEVTIPGETGWLVRPGDAPGLADAILRLMRDPAARLRMGQAGRRLVISRFHADTMVDRIAEVYERLLRDRGLVPPSP